MGILNRILGTIILLLLIVSGILASCWQHDKATIESLKKQSALDAAAHAQAQLKYNATLETLNRNTLIQTQQLIDQQTQAKANYESQLENIADRYHATRAISQRLSNQIRLLNSQLSKDTPTTLSQYSSTAGNNLAECSQTATEMERLARTYYAAYQQLINAWPVNTPSKIVVVNDHGDQHEYTVPIKIRVDEKNIQPYTP